MKRILLALCAVLTLSGCLPGSLDQTLSSAPPPPAAVADRTVVDEQAMLAVELAYKGARLAAETATDAGLLRGERAARVAAIDNRTYRAVTGLRGIYRAGQGQGWLAALTDARASVTELVSAVKGP